MYDKRIADDLQPFSRIGTQIALANGTIEEEDVILTVYPIVEPSWVQGFMRPNGGKLQVVEVLMYFVPKLLSLESLGQLTADVRFDDKFLLSEEVGSILLLLRIAIPLILESETGTTTIQNCGYFITREHNLRIVMQSYFKNAYSQLQNILPKAVLPADINQLLRVLKRRSGHIWPLISGPVIRREGNIVCIDLKSASSRLEQLLEFPLQDGKLANVRADHFEIVVQQAINNSPWKPSEHIGKLRGMTLRLNRRAITDIDAIGINGKTVLIVSCKSIIYGGLYDIGDYRTVRNISSTVETSVSRWKDIVSFLKENLIGDNYDLSMFNDIIGVVCTPRPAYVGLVIASQFAYSDLQIASSYHELASWLHKPFP